MGNLLKKSKMYDYQTYASEYIVSHSTAAVFLECGLGKTVITLTAINELMFNEFEVREPI